MARLEAMLRSRAAVATIRGGDRRRRRRGAADVRLNQYALLNDIRKGGTNLKSIQFALVFNEMDAQSEYENSL
jgi:hypothetical protein